VPSALNDRAAENWLPLLAIAEVAGDGWPALARKAAISLCAIDNEEDSVVTALLAALQRIFQEAGQAEEDDDFLSTEYILNALNADREAPWADWRRGDGISAEKLARMLKPFGVKSAQIQRDNVRDRGYVFGHLKPVFERYLSPEGPAT
jgi:putative DNA primase/helicase